MLYSKFVKSRMELIRTYISALRMPCRPSLPMVEKQARRRLPFFRPLSQCGLLCGYQSFLGPFGKENSTYISYEKQPDDTTRVVHNTLVHMHDTCGGDNTRLQNTSIKNDAYLAHLRFENLFLRQFATDLDTDKIQSLYEEACYRK
jgi:hypothetical protein